MRKGMRVAGGLGLQVVAWGLAVAVQQFSMAASLILGGSISLIGVAIIFWPLLRRVRIQIPWYVLTEGQARSSRRRTGVGPSGVIIACVFCLGSFLLGYWVAPRQDKSLALSQAIAGWTYSQDGHILMSIDLWRLQDYERSHRVVIVGTFRGYDVDPMENELIVKSMAYEITAETLTLAARGTWDFFTHAYDACGAISIVALLVPNGIEPGELININKAIDRGAVLIGFRSIGLLYPPVYAPGAPETQTPRADGGGDE